MSYVAIKESAKKLNKSYNKVALFGGVYNNHLALRKACQMAVAHGCEALFCLGDLGGFGPSPNKVFPILEEYEVQCIQGNYEESLITRLADCGCGYTHPRDNHYAQISYDYTNNNLTEKNRKILETYPKQLQFQLGPKTVHLCHGSPRRINEFLWETTTSSGFLRALMRDLGADVLCCTHSGLQWKREVEPGKWLVNVGVLGRPANDGKTNVWYAELTYNKDRVQVEHIPVEYNWESLAQEMEAEKLPKEFVDTIRQGWWTTCLEIMPGKERANGQF